MDLQYYARVKQLTQERESDAGFDIYADGIENDTIIIPANRGATIPTGLFMEIEEGYYGKIFSRSGMAFKREIIIFGGVVDSQYRGEVFVKLFNHSTVPQSISNSDKIAQMVFMKTPKVELNRVPHIDFLSNTERNNKGFGSSGN